MEPLKNSYRTMDRTSWPTQHPEKILCLLLKHASEILPAYDHCRFSTRQEERSEQAWYGFSHDELRVTWGHHFRKSYKKPMGGQEWILDSHTVYSHLGDRKRNKRSWRWVRTDTNTLEWTTLMCLAPSSVLPRPPTSLLSRPHAVSPHHSGCTSESPEEL